jgi:membrane protease YdiL (CAAX protease family)
MQTTIGVRLSESRPRTAATALVAGLVVAADFWLVKRGDYSYVGPRGALPLLALASYLFLARGELAAVGLRIRPLPDPHFWLRATVLVGVAAATFTAAAFATMGMLGWELPIRARSPDEFWPEFVRMCILAPAVEEGTYRLGFCCGALALLRPRGTIVASGLIFGALHVLYGNPGPDNLVAGFLLAWAFFKSGSILVPMALHALGNLCVLSAWIGMGWYLR